MYKWIGWMMLFLAGMAHAAGYKPFIKSTVHAQSLEEAAETVKSKLQQAGMTVVGEYHPRKKTWVIVVTNPYLKKLAALSENGGFGAMERVAIKNYKGTIGIGYTNPYYWWNVYRMKGDIQPVAEAMERALGNGGQYGAKHAFSAEALRNYRYMGMPDFKDVDELYTYKSHQQGIDVIEKNLAKGVAGTQKVYRIDIPGTEMSVWGVAMRKGDASDLKILKVLDRKLPTHAAHLPYEILLNGKQAVALKGEFRIAISWPTQTMWKFMKIGRAPDTIETVLMSVASPTGKPKEEDILDEM